MPLKHHRGGNLAWRVQSDAPITCMPVILECAEELLIRQLVLVGQATPKQCKGNNAMSFVHANSLFLALSTVLSDFLRHQVTDLISYNITECVKFARCSIPEDQHVY